MREDPLRGLTARQRIRFERKAARFFGNYEAAENQGWLAGELRAGRIIIAERLDLQHPARSAFLKRSDCVDCGANLQYEMQIGHTAICIACAYRRALHDD